MANQPKRPRRAQYPWSRRRMIWDPPTLLDSILDSPLRFLIQLLHSTLLWLRGASFKPPKNRQPVRVVCISDTHTNTLSLPHGDILIHAGDMTNAGTVEEIQKQLDWLAAQPHREKIVIAGNHDSYFDVKARREEDKKSGKKLDFKGIHYLQDKAVTLRFRGGRKLNFYGAGDIPKCGGSEHAFQYNRDAHPWHERIPRETDVLITHTPPRYHLDLNLGCAGLLEEIWRVRPRLHIFGHVHSGHGREHVFWDEGQRSYERLMERKKEGGILADIIPSSAWMDAAKVLWHGIKGILWQKLMVGPNGGSGGMLVNAAIVYQSTLDVGNPVEVVEV